MANKIATITMCFLGACFFFTCKNEQATNLLAFTNLQEVETPCKEGGEPNLSTSETVMVYLSWVEYLNDQDK